MARRYPAEVNEIAVTGVSSDGAGVGRDADGRVVFIPGALPDETVTVDIVEEKKRHAVGQLLEVVTAAPERIEPSCEAVAAGCGGCDQRHVTPAGQRHLKERIVTDALTRIGRLSELPALTTRPLPDEAYRT
ncbi:MAG: TRAM domain-containing protein, partial [Acidimicrobiales bacterium]